MPAPFTARVPAFYRRHEANLALAQRRGQKRRATALHARTKNCRKHFLHQESTRLVREHGRVIVGDVPDWRRRGWQNPCSNTGWSMLREQLRYKALRQELLSKSSARNGLPRPVPTAEASEVLKVSQALE